MISITEVLEVQNEETKEVARFAVGDVAVFSVTDHTVEGGIVKVTGAIDVIHRVDKFVTVDASTQFHSETRRVEIGKIVNIEKYVAPVAAEPAKVETTPVTTQPTVSTGTETVATAAAEPVVADTTKVEETTPTVAPAVEETAPVLTPANAQPAAPTPMA